MRPPMLIKGPTLSKQKILENMNEYTNESQYERETQLAAGGNHALGNDSVPFEGASRAAMSPVTGEAIRVLPRGDLRAY